MRNPFRVIVIPARSVDALAVATVDEVIFVDAIPQGIRDAADDGPADLGGRHFPQLGGAGIAVPSGMGRTDEIGGIFQRPG